LLLFLALPSKPNEYFDNLRKTKIVLRTVKGFKAESSMMKRNYNKLLWIFDLVQIA